MGKIFIIADQKGRGKATPRGLELADKLGHSAEVHAFVYAPLSKLGVSGAEKAVIKKRLLAEREAVVQARIDRFAKPGQKVKLRVIWEKDIASWVSKKCASSKYDLVIKTGRRSENFAYTSSDWQLLRECTAPVFIVAENKWRRTQPVLAALDLSSSLASKKKLNQQVLARAVELARVMGEELEIISAVEVPTLLKDLDLVDPRTYVANAKRDMVPAIKALAQEFDLPEKAFVVKQGPVEKVIASQAASKRAQMVVMGTVGRRGVKARLVGNTAEKVLKHLNTDIIALKPEA